MTQRYQKDPATGCWLWQGYLDRDGYGLLSVRKAGKRYQKRAHRWIYEQHMGLELAADQLVCHRCDVRHCVNPAHMFTGTTQDNTADMVLKQRQCRGEGIWHKAKLNSDQVRIIRQDPRSYREIALDYQVTDTTIRHIKERSTWRHIK